MFDGFIRDSNYNQDALYHNHRLAKYHIRVYSNDPDQRVPEMLCELEPVEGYTAYLDMLVSIEHLIEMTANITGVKINYEIWMKHE